MTAIRTSPRFRLSAAWVCLVVQLLFVSGMSSWGGGLLSALEGGHSLAVRSTGRQWVVVLGHDRSAGAPLLEAGHQHGFWTRLATSLCRLRPSGGDHLLASEKFTMVLEDRTTVIPAPVSRSLGFHAMSSLDVPLFGPCQPAPISDDHPIFGLGTRLFPVRSETPPGLRTTVLQI